MNQELKNPKPHLTANLNWHNARLLLIGIPGPASTKYLDKKTLMEVWSPDVVRVNALW